MSRRSFCWSTGGIFLRRRWDRRGCGFCAPRSSRGRWRLFWRLIGCLRQFDRAFKTPIKQGEPSTMTTIIGVDCANEDKKVGLARGILTGGRLEVSEALSSFRKGAVLATLCQWIDPSTPTLLAIDAPLGWPSEMGTILADHKAGEPITVEPNHFFRRRTDIDVKKRWSHQPLDIGADGRSRLPRTLTPWPPLPPALPPPGRGGTRTPPSQPRALPWAKIFWPFRPEKPAQSRVRLQG